LWLIKGEGGTCTILPPPPLPAPFLALEQFIALLHAIPPGERSTRRGDVGAVDVVIVEYDGIPELQAGGGGFLGGSLSMGAGVEGDGEGISGSAGDGGDVERFEGGYRPGLDVDGCCRGIG